MNESSKKVLLIVLVVVALGVAGFSAFRYLGDGTTVGNVNDLPPGTPTGKELEMRAMEQGQAAGRQEVDLGGDIDGRQ